MLPALFLFEFLMPILFDITLSDMIDEYTSDKKPIPIELFYITISLLMWVRILGYLGN